MYLFHFACVSCYHACGNLGTGDYEILKIQHSPDENMMKLFCTYETVVEK